VQSRLRPLRVIDSVEEPVGHRPGAADVGPEGTFGSEPFGERGAREIVRRERGEVARPLDGGER